MRHRHSARQMLLLLRDALGRFTRVRATLTELAATIRPRRRTRRTAVATAVQLTLF